ncbi:hexokinase-3-like isoform X2 [Andrographis paniculata]|uniref:hexokinase-3-like isoform X2 n=1 Tax=Andrographis paniculata TaxID=175694 RepID=UPI0021E74FF3|nr:hexokinase-3-like isoform X2 [Andrographis paniculata]
MGKLAAALAVGCAVAACVVASVVVGRSVRRRRAWARASRIVEELEEGCATPVWRLRQIVDAMAVEMHAGLASEGGSKLKMLLTYVQNLPTGNENGTYYALDIGETNLRILRVHLGGQRHGLIEHDLEQRPIPQTLLNSTSEELFDFIAASLKEFVESKESSMSSLTESRELGFTFSFPVKQTTSSSGYLIKWTKGFSVEDMINDTVGTLALGHYHDEDTVAAVVFGTGTNACYMERADAIIKCQGVATTSGGMVVNMEWGNFWSSNLPRTSYDMELDDDSPNPNDQCFEKMISGMYLGDIVRRVILQIAQKTDVFGLEYSKLHEPSVLRTPLMAIMHEDDSPYLIEVSQILKDTLEIPDVSLNLRKLIVKICDVVVHRAARLAAAGIVGILKKIGIVGGGTSRGGGSNEAKMRRIVVAVEGGLYTNYTMFREYLNEAMGQILGEDIAACVVMKVTEDGSGIGAALLAASHSSSSSSSSVDAFII